MKHIENQGFGIIKNVISKNLAKHIYNISHDHLISNSKRLNVNFAEYMNLTGKWGKNSLLVKEISNYLDILIQRRIEEYLNKDIKKMDCELICKTKYLKESVPFHHDLPYGSDPSHINLYLGLNDINLEDGGLDFIKNSHHWESTSFIDYFQPFYKDLYRLRFASEIVPTQITSGDAILYDSRIMHSLREKISDTDGYIYCTKWKIREKELYKKSILEESFFGVFNSKQKLYEILFQGAIYFKLIKYNSDKYELDDLASLWINFLSSKSEFINIELCTAIENLRSIKNFIKAESLDDANSLSGTVYKNIWKNLLKAINSKIRILA